MKKKILGFIDLEDNKFKELNSKWVAIILKGRKANDSELIRDGNFILADENLIEIQVRVAELYPELDIEKNNINGKLVKYGYVPKKLEF